MQNSTIAAHTTNTLFTNAPSSKRDAKEEAQLEKTRTISIIEGLFASVSSGFGEAYISAFAVAINSSNTMISLITAVPNLIAPISQAFTPKVMEKYGRKRIVVPGVFIQACMWIAFAIVAFLFMNGFQYSPYLLLLFFTIYAILGHFTAPAWLSWMGDIIPENKGEYWGMRSTICGIMVIVTTFAAGVFLDAFNNINLMFGFAIIFLISFVGRTFSSYFFTKHYEPKLKLPEGYYFSFFDFIKRMWGNNYGKYVMFIALGTFAGTICGPFIAVYMLRGLQFDYILFTVVTLAASVANIATLPLWGKYVDKHGDLKVLWLTGIGVCFGPLLWAVSGNVYYLVAIQVFNGIVSAGFGIATTNYFFDAVTPQRRSLCSAYSAILNGVGIFFGSIIGGILLLFDFGINPFIFIFLVAGILRLILSLAMLPQIKEVNKHIIAADG